MARSMLSHGMFSALAASIAVRRRGLPPESPPPALAAIVISRMSRVKRAPRFWSVTAFFRLICFHLLWPAIGHFKLKLDCARAPQVGFPPMCRATLLAALVLCAASCNRDRESERPPAVVAGGLPGA